MKNPVRFKSLKNTGLLAQLTISFLLMSILPLCLMLYIIYELAEPVSEEASNQMGILMFLIIASLSAGYIMSRQMVMAIMQIVKEAKMIANGDYSRRVASHNREEINRLSQYFNRITKELEDHIAELEESKKTIQRVLSRIGQAMSSPERIEDILGLTLETLTGALGAKVGIIWLKHEDRDILFPRFSYGKTLKKIELSPGEGIAGWAAKEGKALNLDATQNDNRFSKEAELGYIKQSCLCVPMIFEKRIIGSLCVADKARQQRFSDDDLILLGNLASQIAIALENARLKTDIERAYFQTVSALALAVEAKDRFSHGHSARVTEYVTKAAGAFNLSEEDIQTLRDAGVLHDLGKIGIKDEILFKPTPLTPEEAAIMHKHTVIGESILRPIYSLANVCYLVRHHHEREDGNGYPDGLKGGQMSLPLKILVVADAYDAMTSDRPYRKGLAKEKAVEELRRYAGIYFDKEVVGVFTKMI